MHTADRVGLDVFLQGSLPNQGFLGIYYATNDDASLAANDVDFILGKLTQVRESDLRNVLCTYVGTV